MASMDAQQARRVVEVRERVVGPTEPRLKTVHPRKLTDYPHVPQVYCDVAQRLSSPVMMGPPICDELMEFVQHLLTEEEAGVVRHLGLLKGRRVADIARAEHRPADQIQPILDRLSKEKQVLARSGSGVDARYRLLPIVPGIFEMVLASQTLETLTDWHRRFSELFERLYETGYSLDYQRSYSTPFVRFLPVGKAIEAHPMALPTDKLEVVMDEFETFAVVPCQCRMSMAIQGQSCGKPLENCMLMGTWAERGIEEGSCKQVSKKDAVEIKREAEAHGLVNWMMNVRSSRGQSSCSCCGCCCHAMRMVSEFNAPAVIAPPHFLPRLDASRCTHCGKCAMNCPMGALVVDLQRKTWTHLRERCIGCGLCVLACDRQKALVMEAVPDYRPPYHGWFSLIAHALPGVLFTNWRVRRDRRR
jgi:Pyruvate/2-oxoacid:ferredoxin oxidoreductase delta subunit